MLIYTGRNRSFTFLFIVSIFRVNRQQHVSNISKYEDNYRDFVEFMI